jgi:hypothetical protein
MIPYISAFVVFLCVFLPWELSALRKKRNHLTLSEYVWRWQGSSGFRKSVVAGAILGGATVLALHLARLYFV